MKNNLVYFLFLFLLFGCTETKETTEYVVADPDSPDYKTLEGYFQDGPCLAGATVTAKPLNDELNQIVGHYIGETRDDYGRYTVPAELVSNYAEVFADATCHNEVTGGVMSAKRLSAIIDLNAGESNNISPLTTIRSSVARNLVNARYGTAGQSLLEAERLILAYMNMPTLTNRFTDMTLEVENRDNAVLLAVNSALLLGRSEAEQLDFMQKIAEDINASTDVYRGEFLQNVTDLPIVQIKTNLESRYSALGRGMSVPPFWQVTGSPSYFSDLLENAHTVLGTTNLDDTGNCQIDSAFNTFALPHVFESGIETAKYIALNIQGDEISIWTRDVSNDIPETKLVDIEKLDEVLMNDPVTLSYNGILPDAHGLDSSTDYYIVTRSDTDFTLSTACGNISPFFLPFGRKLFSGDEGSSWTGNLNNTPFFRKSGVKVVLTD